MKKVVFFIFNMSPRIDRRICEFVENGYMVDVYGYGHSSITKYISNDVYKYQVVCEINEKVSYAERLKNLLKFWKILHSYNRKDTLFYFFSLNVAVMALFTPAKSYIYEESDMLFDRFRSYFFRSLTIKFNKYVIKKSLLTVFTSEGFSEYYFAGHTPSNVFLIPNKVSSECLKLPTFPSKNFNKDCVVMGFVGNIRYQTILNVSDVIAQNYPQISFHYYGDAIGLSQDQINHIKSQEKERVYFHGPFKNPDDLASIYSNLDIVVCTYDTEGVNPRYAEPNKLYEAIFFRTPIIVSNNSFLADKVERLGIGFSIDSNNKNDIDNKIGKITSEQYQSMINCLEKIPRESSVNINTAFFEKLESLL